MEVVITRNKKINDNALSGTLNIFDKDMCVYACITLENYEKKIPKGCYNISNTYSPKFNCDLWAIKNVPKRRGIRIHPFNYAKQSDGCIGLGSKFLNLGNYITNSRKTLREFNTVLNKYETYKLTIK